MVIGVSAVVDDPLDGLGHILLHFERLAEGGQGVVPLVLGVDGLLKVDAKKRSGGSEIFVYHLIRVVVRGLMAKCRARCGLACAGN